MSRLSLVIVMGFGLLAYTAASNGGEQPGFEQRAPWFVQESHNAETGVPEYFAITRSLEDSDFWRASPVL